MAMKIGSKYKFSEVQARHWEQFSGNAGLAEPQAKRRILELAKSLPASARKLQSDPGRGFAGNALVEQIVTLIEQRCALTATHPRVVSVLEFSHRAVGVVDAGVQAGSHCDLCGSMRWALSPLVVFVIPCFTGHPPGLYSYAKNRLGQ